MKLKESRTYCDRCDSTLEYGYLKTIYGEYLCDDCWDEYINTEPAKAEYVISIATGDSDVSDYSQAELADMAIVWKKYKDSFELPSAKIKQIERDAIAAGFKF